MAQNEKEKDLREKIAHWEKRLHDAELESKAWNRGKYSHTSNAELSLLMVDSIKNQIQKLYDELSELKN